MKGGRKISQVIWKETRNFEDGRAERKAAGVSRERGKWQTMRLGKLTVGKVEKEGGEPRQRGRKSRACRVD